MDFRVFKELKGLMVLMVRCCWEEKVKKDRQATKESRAHQGHQDQRQAPYGYIHHGVEHSNSEPEEISISGTSWRGRPTRSQGSLWGTRGKRYQSQSDYSMLWIREPNYTLIDKCMCRTQRHPRGAWLRGNEGHERRTRIKWPTRISRSKG